MNIFRRIGTSAMDSVRYVNERYKKPEIKTPTFLKICLLALRIYLLLMIVLMGIFLVKQATSAGDEQPASAAQSQPAAAPSGAPETTQAR
jgi:flagellar biosynthesis/type III secretory pathway M-ring protein FliF/YscJ